MIKIIKTDKNGSKPTQNRGANDVMITVIGNGHSDTSSNSG